MMTRLKTWYAVYRKWDARWLAYCDSFTAEQTGHDAVFRAWSVFGVTAGVLLMVSLAFYR